MKANFFVSLLLLFCGLIPAWSQTVTNSMAAPAVPKPHVVDVPQPNQAEIIPAAPEAPLDPAKLAEFQKRFQQGLDLEQQGKLAEALAVYDGIIADSPDAKGSLLHAGFISVRLNDLLKADDYFEKLHALVPEFPTAIEALIQINQSLKRDIKVSRLIKEFRDLRSAGKVPLPYFVRERIHLDQGLEIVFTEFFDYKQDPNSVWMAEVFDETGQLQRRLLLNYDPGATDELQKKDPKLANAEQFFLIEDVLKDGKPVRLDAYFQMFALPEYKKIRATMFAIIGGAYKPIYSRDLATPPAQ